MVKCLNYDDLEVSTEVRLKNKRKMVAQNLRFCHYIMNMLSRYKQPGMLSRFEQA